MRDADEARDEVATDSEQAEDTKQANEAEEKTGQAASGEPEDEAAEAEAEAEKTDEPEPEVTEEKAAEPEPAEDEKAAKAEAKQAAKQAKAEAKKAKKAAKDAKPKTKMAIERKRQATPLICCAFLVILSIVAMVLPMWSIPRGHVLGGGSLVTLTASDYDENATASDALSKLKSRANDLDQLDLSVAQSGDDTFTLRVPASYDASTVADALTRHGKFELARVDTISDADALQKIQNSAENIEVADGAYEAFVTGGNVKKASVVEQTYYGTTYYTLTIELDDEGADSLASVTEDLADSSGQIAVIMDNVILSTPSVSSKLEGGKISISGGFTEDEAYSLAAAINSGELPCSLSQTEPESFSGPFGGHAAFVIGMGALVLAAVITIAACAKFGMGSLVVLEGEILVVLASMGILTILYRFDLVIMGTFELMGLGLAEVSGMLVGFFLVRCYHKRRAEGLSVRKAQQRACEMILTRSAAACAACVAVFIVAAILLHGSMRELFVSAAAADFALLVLIPLYFDPAIRVFTANDATRAKKLKAAEKADAAADGE